MTHLDFDPRLSRCPLCDGADLVRHATDYKGIRIDRCAGCGTRFMNPQYSDEHLRNFYSDYQDTDASHHRYGDATLPRELVHEHNLSRIEAYVEPGRLLSVGCGNGLDLRVATRRGWQAEGFEVDGNHAARLADELGLPVTAGDFASADFDAASFDCVYLNHVLEHPRNPGAYLRRIGHVLRPGGLLHLACPNIESWSIRLKTVMERLGLKRNRGKHYDTGQHLVYYAPQQLARALETHFEFEVLELCNDVKADARATSVEPVRLDRILRKSGFRLLARRRRSG